MAGVHSTNHRIVLINMNRAPNVSPTYYLRKGFDLWCIVRYEATRHNPGSNHSFGDTYVAAVVIIQIFISTTRPTLIHDKIKFVAAHALKTKGGFDITIFSFTCLFQRLMQFIQRHVLVAYKTYWCNAEGDEQQWCHLQLYSALNVVFTYILKQC